MIQISFLASKTAINSTPVTPSQNLSISPVRTCFLSTEGRRLHPDNFIKRRLKPILKKLGLDGAAHAFRHGKASLLDHPHAPMKGRQDRLGHQAQSWATRT